MALNCVRSVILAWIVSLDSGYSVDREAKINSSHEWIRQAFSDDNERAKEIAVEWLRDNAKTLNEQHRVLSLIDVFPVHRPLPREIEVVAVDYQRFLLHEYTRSDSNVWRTKFVHAIMDRPSIFLFLALLQAYYEIPGFDASALEGWMKLTNSDHGLCGEYARAIASNTPDVKLYVEAIKTSDDLRARNLIWAASWTSNRQLWEGIVLLSSSHKPDAFVNDYCDALGRIVEQLVPTKAPTGEDEDIERLNSAVARLRTLVPMTTDAAIKQRGKRALYQLSR